MDKRQRHVARQRRCIERMRGGGGAMTRETGQPAGEHEANWRGGITGQDAMEH